MPALKKNSYLLPVVAGLLHYAAFPPLLWWPLSFVSLAPFFLFVRAESSRRRLLLGSFFYCAIYAVLAIIFIPDPATLLGGIGLWLLIFAPSALLLKRYAANDSIFFCALALALVAAEFVAGQFALLPAFLIMSGIPLAGTPFMFIARFGGVAAASVAVAEMNAAIVFALARFQAGKRGSAAAGLIAFALLLGCCFGARFLPREAATLPYRVMAVSADAEFASGAAVFEDPAFVKEKSGSDALDSFLTKTLSPIGAAVEQERPTLLVLPEGMIKLVLPGVADAGAQRTLGITNAGPLLASYAAFAATHRVYLMATLTTIDTAAQKHISTILIDPTGQFLSRYDKRHLTPYSERWPFGGVVPFYFTWASSFVPPSVLANMRAEEDPANWYQPGALAPDFTVAEAPVGALICLEGHLPYLYWQQSQSTFIVYSGSNSWLLFLRGYYQDLTVKLRQLEVINTGVPLIVAGDGEPPAVMWPDGTVARGADPAPPSSWSYIVR